MIDLGNLHKVDLRQVWSNEATEFTPWLAQQLSELSNTLGMELELHGQEVPVGEFSTDILARDLGSDRLVIIENQLESTDHDHLGKLLTYAAGHDADAVVWITKEFREPHRQALDWLNQRTGTETEFYGIVVEVFRIDDSRPAVKFRPVAFLNEWRKINFPPKETTEREEAYRHFFQTLIDELRENHNFTKARKGQPQSWYQFASGFSNIGYAVSFAQEARVRAEVYLDKPNQAFNKKIFDALFEEKTMIEEEYGEPLEWERLDEGKASRIAVYREGQITDSPQSLEEIKKWAIDQLLRFKKVFSQRLKQQLK